MPPLAVVEDFDVLGDLANRLLPRFVASVADEFPASLPDKQFCVARIDHRPTLSLPVANRTVLQVDQAAPSNQGVLWRHIECRQDAKLDRHHRGITQYHGLTSSGLSSSCEGSGHVRHFSLIVL